jgi:hypothetical protein
VTLEAISRLIVPRSVIEETEKALQAAGRDGYELFVLWSGGPVDDEFLVETAHVPKQSSYKTEEGLLVRIEADALHGLNAWLYKNVEILGAQVHAHPTKAFHSTTDDTYPIVTALGGFSIVAADFAVRGLLASDSAIYRLTPRGWDDAGPINSVIEVD